MERLGLWGPGCAFKSFEHFHDTVRHKGLGEPLHLGNKGVGLSRIVTPCMAWTMYKQQDVDCVHCFQV
jgi:hypothetical protein